MTFLKDILNKLTLFIYSSYLKFIHLKNKQILKSFNKFKRIIILNLLKIF